MARRPYKREMSKTSWFLTHSRYKHYMLHEVSSLFVAIYAILLVFGLFRLGEGPESWQGWVDYMSGPIGVIINLIVFAFSIVHTTAWFKVVPQAMRIQRGDEFVPGNLIVGAHYGLFGAVSLLFIILAGVA